MTVKSSNLLIALLLGVIAAAPAAPAQTQPGSPWVKPNGAPNRSGMSPYMTLDGPTTPENNVPFIQQHVSETIRQNMAMEIEFSQMALKRSRNPKIKQFARQLIDENRLIADGAKQFAPDKSGTFPSPMFEGIRQAVEANKAKKKMETLTGPAFDRMYLFQMNSFAENDQQVGHATYAMMNLPGGVSPLGRRMWDMANARVKQIDVLARELHVKLNDNRVSQ
ncbi:MAG TPA: DUF4142 domain-containing protein [Acidobacteriaceae bacterium]|nr:DUF4142 domain-containing protein [Acidobacteriaceae bacterium]